MNGEAVVAAAETLKTLQWTIKQMTKTLQVYTWHLSSILPSTHSRVLVTNKPATSRVYKEFHLRDTVQGFPMPLSLLSHFSFRCSTSCSTLAGICCLDRVLEYVLSPVARLLRLSTALFKLNVISGDITNNRSGRHHRSPRFHVQDSQNELSHLSGFIFKHCIWLFLYMHATVHDRRFWANFWGQKVKFLCFSRLIGGFLRA